MKKNYFQNKTSIDHMYMNVKFDIYYQILNLYKTFFTNMQHKILKMKKKHNYLIYKMLELHPCLDLQCNQTSNLSSSISLNFQNQNTFINFQWCF